MNKLWFRLSTAFIVVITLTIIITFSLFFALSWVDTEPLNENTFEEHFYDAIAPFVEYHILDGKNNEEIVSLLNTDQILQDMLLELREAGFAVDTDIRDRSFQRILGDYLIELTNPDIIQTLIIGAIVSIIASIVVSRQQTYPLSKLTNTISTFDHRDLTRRVDINGSDEINDLSEAFNSMMCQLEEASQLRQKMLADVSHELRTPLSGLEGMLRATLDGVFPLDHQHISDLYKQTQHLTHLVDDLFLLARAEAGSLPLNDSKIELSELIQEILRVFEILAHEKNIQLVQHMTTNCYIWGDAVRIRQVLSNVIINALHHTPSDGQIQIIMKQSNKFVEITISDTGTGILKEHLPHLFDRFYRVDASRSRMTGGTGLGLAIVKALIDIHGGTIQVESPGLKQGSTFTISFPIYDK
ncbi:MAG: ATP-binding protein [Bacteroidota bacterium]